MAGASPVVAVGTGLSNVQFQAERQAATVRLEKQVIQDLGSAALRLIQATVGADPALARNLDELA
jgi:hypothetical protein